MASEKVIAAKKEIVQEIKEKLKNSNTVVFFDYLGLTVTEVTELRKKLREANSEFKVYKNTLTKRALDELNISLNEFMNGPNGIVFSQEQIKPIKILAEFAKKHKALELKIGIIDGEISEKEMLDKLATLPTKEELLTMLARGMMQPLTELAISLDLYSKEKN